MGSIAFDVQLSENGKTTNGSMPKLAFIIPTEITRQIGERYPNQQLKVTMKGARKTITFVINLTIHSKKKGKERLKGMIPKKHIKDAQSFKEELVHIKIESI